MGEKEKMSARDVILTGVLIFTLGLTFVVVNYMYGDVVDEMLLIDEVNQSNATINALEDGRTISNRLDYVLFAVFIGLILAIIISGWFVGGNAIFMFIYFIFLVIAVSVSAVLSYVWEDIPSRATVLASTITGNFPITNHILVNLPMYITVIGFIGVIVMFAKPFFQEGVE